MIYTIPVIFLIAVSIVWYKSNRPSIEQEMRLNKLLTSVVFNSDSLVIRRGINHGGYILPEPAYSGLDYYFYSRYRTRMYNSKGDLHKVGVM